MCEEYLVISLRLIIAKLHDDRQLGSLISTVISISWQRATIAAIEV